MTGADRTNSNAERTSIRLRPNISASGPAAKPKTVATMLEEATSVPIRAAPMPIVASKYGMATARMLPLASP